ncbi:hypothetical protein L286_09655 [Sphingobium sp. HDIP04]|nr:hypothetical protein L286_09655 [Sphingobium sp. HDIP04]
MGLQTQSRYEKAETEPGASYFASLADAGVDVLFILTGDRQSDSLPVDVGRAAKFLMEMTPDARASFLKLMETLANKPPFPPAKYRTYL